MSDTFSFFFLGSMVAPGVRKFVCNYSVGLITPIHNRVVLCHANEAFVFFFLLYLLAYAVAPMAHQFILTVVSMFEMY